MYSYQDIQRIDLEISSECNAACPRCPRNFNGYPNNRGYPEHNMTLQEAKIIFTPDFLSRIKRISLNGNFGDLVMNPQTIDIIEYFRSHTPDDCIYMASTNAGARDKTFWTRMAELGVKIYFCLDGIDDATHGIYRRNTLYTTVIKNAQTFIAAGGRAWWKMIIFDHNTYQIEQAETLSRDMGFEGLFKVDQKRDTGPIYDKNFNLVGKLGNWQDWNKHAVLARMNEKHHVIHVRDLKNEGYRANISCRVKRIKEIYVSSTGRVWPCCYMGYEPETFERGSRTRLAYQNQQLLDIMHENNALVHGLENCINWFDRVERSWTRDSFDEGRLIVCNDSCGAGNPYHDHTN